MLQAKLLLLLCCRADDEQQYPSAGGYETLVSAADSFGAEVVRVRDPEHFASSGDGRSRPYRMHRAPGTSGPVGTSAADTGAPMWAQPGAGLRMEAQFRGMDELSHEVFMAEAQAIRSAVYGVGMRPGARDDSPTYLHGLRTAERQAQALAHSSNLSRPLYDGVPPALVAQRYVPQLVDASLVAAAAASSARARKRKSTGTTSRSLSGSPNPAVTTFADLAALYNPTEELPRWESPERSSAPGLGAAQDRWMPEDATAAAAIQAHAVPKASSALPKILYLKARVR